jgi:hypothetical protein
MDSALALELATEAGAQVAALLTMLEESAERSIDHLSDCRGREPTTK